MSMIARLARACGQPQEDVPHGKTNLWADLAYFGLAPRALLVFLITSKQLILQGSAQAAYDQQPGFAEQGQEKPILQMAT